MLAEMFGDMGDPSSIFEGRSFIVERGLWEDKAAAAVDSVVQVIIVSHTCYLVELLLNVWQHNADGQPSDTRVTLLHQPIDRTAPYSSYQRSNMAPAQMKRHVLATVWADTGNNTLD